MKGCFLAVIGLIGCFAILYLALSMLIWAVCVVFGIVFNPFMALGVLCIASIISILYRLFK